MGKVFQLNISMHHISLNSLITIRLTKFELFENGKTWFVFTFWLQYHKWYMFVWISIFIYGLRALDLSWWRFYIRFKFQSFVLKQEGCVIVCEHVGCQGSRISGNLVAGVSACRYCRLRTVHTVHCKSFTSHTLFSVHTIQTVHTPNCTNCSLHILFSIQPMHNALCIFLYCTRCSVPPRCLCAYATSWSWGVVWDNLPSAVRWTLR